MINKPTALILGAGASIPYGFPSGYELLRRVISQTGRNSPWLSTLRLFDITPELLEEFKQALMHSGQPSVDAFLEYRTEFLKVGKLAIALSLIPHEVQPVLFDFKNIKNSWYCYLFNKLNTSFNNFHKNKLNIITFNYDRSLEYYLFTALKNTHNKANEDCAEKIKQIPIIHVHGHLGALPWQKDGGRDYNNTCTKELLEKASENILVVSESKRTSPEFRKAFEILKKVDKIYFLGFGYHQANLYRLRIKELKQKTLIGSAYEMGASEIDNIQRKWSINLAGPIYDVLGFLKNEVILE